ncbi:MAG TPA: hypothetical protein PKC69_14965 [Chitinophagaceae bacterium]|nr:hypothetical protein [Chitinophagaceae bacterium]
MPVHPPLCQNCHKPVKGRSDKKFCNDFCRNSYNNRQNAHSETTRFIKKINSTLLRNRRLLAELLTGHPDMVKTTRRELLSAGFSFSYFTHTYHTKNAKTYYYCYDMGYLPLDNDWVLVVKKREEGKDKPSVSD